jgi:hypothetical protein
VVRLVRISEQAQADDAAIAFLARAGLLPGTVIDVVAAGAAPAPGIPVRGPQGEHLVPPSTAALVWVTPA